MSQRKVPEINQSNLIIALLVINTLLLGGMFLKSTGMCPFSKKAGICPFAKKDAAPTVHYSPKTTTAEQPQ